MHVTQTRVRHSRVPAYFLGRPSAVYIDRYLIVGGQRPARHCGPERRRRLGPGAFDDRLSIDAVGQGAEHQPAGSGEPRCAERIGDGGDRSGAAAARPAGPGRGAR